MEYKSRLTGSGGKEKWLGDNIVFGETNINPFMKTNKTKTSFKMSGTTTTTPIM